MGGTWLRRAGGLLSIATEAVLEKQPMAWKGAGFQWGPLAWSTLSQGDEDPGSKLTFPSPRLQPDRWLVGSVSGRHASCAWSL